MFKSTQLTLLGIDIKKMRTMRKLTQAELAMEAGVRKATISDIERGKSNFRIETLIKITNALIAYCDISISNAEYDI